MKKIPCLQFLSIFFVFFISLSTSLAEPSNLSLVRQQVIQYHDSGEYQRELTEAIKNAHQYISSQTKPENHQKMAIVLDIDETSLSNYNYMVSHDFSYDQNQFQHYILQANADAIKPMLVLYNDAIKQGVSVFFITGRAESERGATITNLHKAGYKHWAGLYLRSDNDQKATAIDYKSKVRETLTKKGYRILASIGDQTSDIKGGFVQRGFKLPNPFYYIP